MHQGACFLERPDVCAIICAIVALRFVSSNQPLTLTQSNDIRWAESVRIIPQRNRGQGDIVPLLRTPRPGAPPALFFVYQRDKFNYDPATHSFTRLAYPCDAEPPLSEFKATRGLASLQAVSAAKTDFGKNEFSIPVPTFRELFAEHAVAPFLCVERPDRWR